MVMTSKFQTFKWFLGIETQRNGFLNKNTCLCISLEVKINCTSTIKCLPVFIGVFSVSRIIKKFNWNFLPGISSQKSIEKHKLINGFSLAQNVFECGLSISFVIALERNNRCSNSKGVRIIGKQVRL